MNRGKPPGSPLIINCPDCWGRIAMDGFDEHKEWACNPSGVPSIIVLAISEKFEHEDFAKSVIRKMATKYPEIEIRMPKGNSAAKELAYFIEAMGLSHTLYKSGGEWEAGARNRALLSGIRHFDNKDSERIGKRAHLSIVFSAGTSTADNPWDVLKTALRVADPVLLYKEMRGAKKVFKGIQRFQNNPKRPLELGEGVPVLAPE